MEQEVGGSFIYVHVLELKLFMDLRLTGFYENGLCLFTFGIAMTKESIFFYSENDLTSWRVLN